MPEKKHEYLLKGTPICRGVAIGQPHFVSSTIESVPEFDVGAEGVEEEVTRYKRALHYSFEDIQKLQRLLERENFLEGVSLLDAQLQMIQDPLLTFEVEQEIIKTKKNAESVFLSIVNRYQNTFQSLDDAFFKERYKDIQDVFKRIMRYLCARTTTSLPANTNPILISHDLTVTDVLEANILGINAILTEGGSPTSHVAIMAKAKGIPYVCNIDPLKINQKKKDIIVDGRTGEVILNPTPETLKKYQDLQKLLKKQAGKLKELKELTSHTLDGHHIHLTANIAMSHEIDVIHQHGGNGVGLFRSEYLFLSGESFLLEEEQFQIYKKMAQRLKGLPLVIRTFDVGADKKFINHVVEIEENPSLGCRGIRFLLKEKELFKTQLRAILRASAFGDVRILFPFVSTLSELLEAKNLIKNVQSELKIKGCEYDPKIKIGCMIEIPSAAMISDLLAQECDFLSIGTNDLTQYALAVDRNNHRVRFLHTPAHPSVIRLLRHIAKAATEHNVPVTICGEIAADPRFTALWVGLGIYELSVSACHLPAVKNIIRKLKASESKRLAEYILTLRTAEDVLSALSHYYQKLVPDDCLYNCEL